jgi:hypothetical protein
MLYVWCVFAGVVSLGRGRVVGEDVIVSLDESSHTMHARTALSLWSRDEPGKHAQWELLKGQGETAAKWLIKKS